MDFGKMMGAMKEMQEKLKAAQENLVNVTATGEAGAGMVKATANGNKTLVELEIDPSLLKQEEREMVQDLVIAAVNQAISNAEALAKEEMKKSTGNVIPDIPGLDLSKFM